MQTPQSAATDMVNSYGKHASKMLVQNWMDHSSGSMHNYWRAVLFNILKMC